MEQHNDKAPPPFSGTVRLLNPEPKESGLWRLAKSPWLGPSLLILGWGPLFVMDVLDDFGITDRHLIVGLGMGWGMAVAVPATIAAMASILFHLVRAFSRSLVRR